MAPPIIENKIPGNGFALVAIDRASDLILCVRSHGKTSQGKGILGKRFLETLSIVQSSAASGFFSHRERDVASISAMVILDVQVF